MDVNTIVALRIQLHQYKVLESIPCQVFILDMDVLKLEQKYHQEIGYGQVKKKYVSGSGTNLFYNVLGIWLMPKRNKYGDWPRSGSIDIMQARGNADLVVENQVQIGVQRYTTALHYGVDLGASAWRTTQTAHLHEESLSKNYHVYKMEWTPGKLTTVGTPFTMVVIYISNINY